MASQPHHHDSHGHGHGGHGHGAASHSLLGRRSIPDAPDALKSEGRVYWEEHFKHLDFDSPERCNNDEGRPGELYRQLKYLVFIAVVAVYCMAGRNDLKLLQDAYYSDRWDK